MYQQIALYSNLNGYNSHNKRSLELYTLLKKYSTLKVVLNPPYQNVKNSIVIISGYSSAFRELHTSNRVFYLSRTGILNYKEVLLLTRIDIIVANSRLEATSIAWQVRNYGFKTKVFSAPPYCKPVTASMDDSIISYAHLDSKYRPAFAGFKLIKASKIENAFAHVHLTDKLIGWPYLILEAMTAGIPSIVKASNPASEHIIHGHNGYVVTDIQDVVKAVTDLRRRREEVSNNCRALSKSFFDPQKYIDLFNSKGRNLNVFGPIKVEHQDRKWIIREKTIQSDGIVYFPTSYDTTIQAIDLVEIIEILEFFSIQLFSDVYVFGCEFPEWYGPTELMRANALVTQLGDRARRAHFCRDEPIPHQWAPAFQKLSLISVAEGLKQTSDKI